MQHLLPACLLALTPLAVCAQQPAAPPVAPPASGDFKLMALEETDLGVHRFVTLVVDGTTARFLVDSGSGSLFVVSQKLAEKLGKKLEDEPLAPGVGEGAIGKRAVFDDLFVGQSIRIKKQNLRVVDFSSVKGISIGTKPVETDGLVGSPFLKAIRAVYDYNQPVLLYPPSGTPKGAYGRARLAIGDLVLPLKEGGAGFPYVTIRLKDKDFEFLLDTVGLINTIEPAVAKELALEQVKAPTAAEGAPVKLLASQPLLAGQKLEKMEFYALTSRAGHTVPKGTRYGGVLGSPFLRSLGARLDFDTYSLVIPKARTQGEKGK